MLKNQSDIQIECNAEECVVCGLCEPFRKVNKITDDIYREKRIWFIVQTKDMHFVKWLPDLFDMKQQTLTQRITTIKKLVSICCVLSLVLLTIGWFIGQQYGILFSLIPITLIVFITIQVVFEMVKETSLVSMQFENSLQSTADVLTHRSPSIRFMHDNRILYRIILKRIFDKNMEFVDECQYCQVFVSMLYKNLTGYILYPLTDKQCIKLGLLTDK